MADLKASLKTLIDRKLAGKQQKLLEGMSYLGEDFVRKAKTSGNYKDRTGNLRSSIGYIVSSKGVIEQEGIEGEQQEGVNKARSFARRIARDFPDDAKVLIGFAAMEYARHVENKNYDVISSSIPDQQACKDLMEKIST